MQFCATQQRINRSNSVVPKLERLKILHVLQWPQIADRIVVKINKPETGENLDAVEPVYACVAAAETLEPGCAFHSIVRDSLFEANLQTSVVYVKPCEQTRRFVEDVFIEAEAEVLAAGQANAGECKNCSTKPLHDIHRQKSPGVDDRPWYLEYSACTRNIDKAMLL